MSVGSCSLAQDSGRASVNRFAVQRVTGGMSNADFCQGADVGTRSFKHDDLVAASPSDETVRVCFACAFAQNLHFFADEGFIALPGPPVNEIEQIVVP